MATEVFFFNKAALKDEAARRLILNLNMRSYDDAAVTINQSAFNAFWNKMPMSFYDMKPEEIFSLLNGEQNPFATKAKQEWIVANGVSHTLMSVGDVVHITSKVIDRVVNRLDKEDKHRDIKEQWLVCVGAGFAKLEFVEVVA